MIIIFAALSIGQTEPIADCATLHGLSQQLLRWAARDAAAPERATHLRQIGEILIGGVPTEVERAAAEALFQEAQQQERERGRLDASRTQVSDVAMELTLLELRLCPSSGANRP